MFLFRWQAKTFDWVNGCGWMTTEDTVIDHKTAQEMFGRLSESIAEGTARNLTISTEAIPPQENRHETDLDANRSCGIL